MPTTLTKSRQKAFQQQSGCCIYCYKPMWTEKPEGFAIKFKLTKRQVKSYQCTAEHLLPCQNGGKDNLNNIAAACKCCFSKGINQNHRCPLLNINNMFKEK